MKSYQLTVRLAGHPAQFYILNIFDAAGSIVRTHTGTQMSYISNLIRTRYSRLDSRVLSAKA